MKKIFKILSILFVGLLMFSCSDPSNAPTLPTEPQRTQVEGYIGKYLAPYVVGDVVFTDGSASSYNEEFTDEQKAAAVAVIFYAGDSNDTLGAKTLGVGLNSKDNISWCSIEAIAYSSDKYSTSMDDGKVNTDEIAGLSDYNTPNYYPAFKFCTDYSVTGFTNGWYLPARNELQKLYDNRLAVGKAFDALGKSKPFSKTLVHYSYWSSSQSKTANVYAYICSAESGSWLEHGYYKYYLFNGYIIVCAVHAF